ncbi:MAG: hypothetical protein HN849_13160 [Victivallales bacterium]|jgi:hypothetical protein|nr:hypothetical protein [Victivallales bacterium]MBT7300462.1 hypothetical protein [Victivallales bacterium]
MAKKKAGKSQKESVVQPEDAMSRVAMLCQESKWREADLLCRQTSARAEKEGKADLAAGLKMALGKIEYSLRRQMAAALVAKSQEFLKKEYLLDVGE